MAITVKKKKLTVKTVKAKAGDPDAPVEAAGAPADAAAAAPAAAAPAAPLVKRASYTVAGIFAIIAFLLFTALLILQGMEFAFYQDAIPRPLSPGMSAPPPAYSTGTGPAPTPMTPTEVPAELTGEDAPVGDPVTPATE